MNGSWQTLSVYSSSPLKRIISGAMNLLINFKNENENVQNFMSFDDVPLSSAETFGSRGQGQPADSVIRQLDFDLGIRRAIPRSDHGPN